MNFSFKIFKDVPVLAPTIGAFYQLLFLFSIGCLNYFSWSQVISDAIIVVCYFVVVYSGLYIASQIQKLKIYFFWTLWIIPEILLWAVIFYAFYYFSGNGMYLGIVYFLLWAILGFSGINSATLLKKPMYLLTVWILISILNVYLPSPINRNVLMVNSGTEENYTYDLIYQNDRFIFWNPRNNSSSGKDTTTIFTAGQENYRIIHDENRKNFDETKKSIQRRLFWSF